jgi:site-specific recombinase XerD
VKDANARTADGKHRINDLLNNLAQVCIDAYHEEAANGNPTPAQIKKHLDKFINQNHQAEAIEEARPTFMELVQRFVNGEMKIMGGDSRGKDKSPNTLKSYKTTQMHLEGYMSKVKRKLDFEDITLDWYMKFTTYLKKEKLSPNSIGKQIKNIKEFMAMANKLTFRVDGEKFFYTTNKEYQGFGVTNNPADAVYLNEAEIMQLYKFDLSNNKRLEAVRDLFVFGCWVGLRFSDYSQIKPENIIKMDGETYIRIMTKKTGELVVIPCNPIVLEIFSKYKKSKNRLPKRISDQKFNTYIKEAARMAGLTDTGRLLTKSKLELCDCISSHTARRSFATNYYLEGFPVIDLMKATGHRSEKSFLRYIRITKEQAAKRMAEFNRKKNWSLKIIRPDKMMKVAG